MGVDFAFDPAGNGIPDAAQKKYRRGKIPEPGGYEELSAFMAD
jgi:hypothetical protein